MIRKFYVLKKRIEKVTEMGQYKFSIIKEKKDGTKIYLVEGGKEPYKIILYSDPRKRPKCNCPDNLNDGLAKKFGIYCKHIVKLLYKLGQEGEILSILLSGYNKDET